MLVMIQNRGWISHYKTHQSIKYRIINYYSVGTFYHDSLTPRHTILNIIMKEGPTIHCTLSGCLQNTLSLKKTTNQQATQCPWNSIGTLRWAWANLMFFQLISTTQTFIFLFDCTAISVMFYFMSVMAICKNGFSIVASSCSRLPALSVPPLSLTVPADGDKAQIPLLYRNLKGWDDTPCVPRPYTECQCLHCPPLC
jgi:hypothetical protein